jgi:hypothetical protein
MGIALKFFRLVTANGTASGADNQTKSNASAPVGGTGGDHEPAKMKWSEAGASLALACLSATPYASDGPASGQPRMRHRE